MPLYAETDSPYTLSLCQQTPVETRGHYTCGECRHQTLTPAPLTAHGSHCEAPFGGQRPAEPALPGNGPKPPCGDPRVPGTLPDCNCHCCPPPQLRPTGAYALTMTSGSISVQWLSHAKCGGTHRALGEGLVHLHTRLHQAILA